MTPEIEKRIKAVRAGRVPAGYKKSKVGIVPKEWDELKLSHYLTVSKEKNKDLQYSKDDVFSISGELGIVNQIELLGRSYAGESVAPYGIVKPYDIVYTKSPLKANPYGIIKTNKTGKTGIVSTLYAIFNCKNNVNPNFVQYYFESDKNLNDYLHPIVNIGAKHDMKISDENSLSGVVVFPPIGEQKKIAEILATQDKVIELKEKLIAEKQYKKNWLIQSMTTGKKRLSSFNGKWTKISLSAVADIVTDSINPCDFQNEKFEVYSLPAFDDGKKPEILYGSEISTNKFLIRKDMVLFNKLNVRQKRVWLVSGDSEYRTISSTEFLPIVVKDIDNVFLTYLLLNDSITSYLKKKSSGTSNSQKRILPKDLMAMKIKVPSLPEQKAIAEVLSAADEEISLLQKDLEQEKRKKKSLMQLLLTGLVKVQ